MTCMEAQQMILPFINDQLNLEQVELFLDHIGSCAECREELEVYYALLTAMKQLDEDQELSDNYPEDLKRKIEGIRERLRKERAAKLRKRFFLFAFIFAFGLVSSVQIGELVYEAQSDYLPRTHQFYLGDNIIGGAFLPERYAHTASFMKEYDVAAKRYTAAMKEKRLRLRTECGELSRKIWFYGN